MSSLAPRASGSPVFRPNPPFKYARLERNRRAIFDLSGPFFVVSVVFFIFCTFLFFDGQIPALWWAASAILCALLFCLAVIFDPDSTVIIANEPDKPLTRPYESWEQASGFNDFEDYLRAQLASAVSRTAEQPDEARVEAFGCYVLSILETDFEAHGVVAQIVLPATWTQPPAWKGGRVSWLKVRTQDQAVFELRYQSLGEDLTVLRFPVPASA